MLTRARCWKKDAFDRSSAMRLIILAALALARHTEEYVSRVGDVLRGALGLEGGIEKE